MKNITTLAALLFSQIIFAQVGINNNTPKATLDITAQTTNGSKPEGLLAPRLTGDQIQAGDAQYTAAQAGIIIYATAAATAPSTKTANITAAGYYFYDGTAWQKLTGGASAADATTTAKGIVQLAGDLSGTAASPAIAANAVTSAKILDGTVANADLATGTGGIYKGSGSLSGNTTVTQGANTLAFTTTATNGFSIDGTTLSVDAANDRVGIGTSAPTATLEVNSGVSSTSGLKLTNLPSANVLATDSNGNIIDGNNSSSGVIITKQRLVTASPSVVINSASGDFSFRYNSTAVSGFVQIRFNKTGSRNISTFITENWVQPVPSNGYFVSSSSGTLASNTWTNIPGGTAVGQTGELNIFRIYDLSNGLTYILELNLVSNSGVAESMILQEF